MEACARNAALLLWALFALFPLVWMLIISFKSDAQMFNTTFFFDPTLENYREVLLKTNYFKCFMDNLIVSAGAVLLSIIAEASPAGRFRLLIFLPAFSSFAFFRLLPILSRRS